MRSAFLKWLFESFTNQMCDIDHKQQNQNRMCWGFPFSITWLWFTYEMAIIIKMKLPLFTPTPNSRCVCVHFIRENNNCIVWSNKSNTLVISLYLVNISIYHDLVTWAHSALTCCTYAHEL